MLYAKNNRLYVYNQISDFNIVKEYLNFASLYKSEETVKVYLICLNYFYQYYINFLQANKTFIEKYLINSLNKKILEDYIRFLKMRKLSDDTIHLRIFAVKDYLKYLFRNNIVSYKKFFDIFEDLKVPRGKVKKQLCIKSSQAIDLIEKIKTEENTFINRRNILMILLISNTGIRRKEVAGINPKDINFNDNTITIYKTKASKPRIIGFSESIKNQLIEYLEEREAILEKHYKNSENLLIKNNGDDLNIKSITQIMKRIYKKHNIKITCHSLRRGFATDMAENKTDIYLLSKMMGHENINTTTSRYIQVLSGAIKEAMGNHPFSRTQDFKIEANKKEQTATNNFNVKANYTEMQEIIFKLNALVNEVNILVKKTL